MYVPVYYYLHGCYAGNRCCALTLGKKEEEEEEIVLCKR